MFLQARERFASETNEFNIYESKLSHIQVKYYLEFDFRIENVTVFRHIFLISIFYVQKMQKNFINVNANLAILVIKIADQNRIFLDETTRGKITK